MLQGKIKEKRKKKGKMEKGKGKGEEGKGEKKEKGREKKQEKKRKKREKGVLLLLLARFVLQLGTLNNLYLKTKNKRKPPNQRQIRKHFQKLCSVEDRLKRGIP